MAGVSSYRLEAEAEAAEVEAAAIIQSYGLEEEAITQFYNCRLLQNHDIVTEDLWVQGGKVLDPEKVFFERKVGPDVKIDCSNMILAPGFIDVQING